VNEVDEEKARKGGGKLGKRRPMHGLKEEMLAFMEDVSIFQKLYPLLQEKKNEVGRGKASASNGKGDMWVEYG
jgi:hypothetical protein